MEQLDLITIIEAEEREKRMNERREKLQQEVKRINAAIGMDEFEQIKANLAQVIHPDSLPWKAWSTFSEYETCNVRAVIPPNAITQGEYARRFPKASYDDPVGKTYMDLWAAYNWCIWHYEPHGVDWCGAFRILENRRDRGEPVWMRIMRVHGIVRFLPECIVEIA